MDKTKEFLFVLNHGPYGSEDSYNGLRMAMNLTKQKDVSVKVFLMGDGVYCAAANQKTPDGYYNVGRMLRAILRKGEVAT